MADIKDVARLAGVSVATVSRVINHSTYVSEPIVKQVNEAIEKLGYRSNSWGRSLRKAQSKNILVLAPTLSSLFYAPIFRGLYETASEQGYNVLACGTGGTAQTEREHLNMLYSRLADAVVLLNSKLSPDELVTLAAHYPVVLSCEDSDIAEICTVDIDNYRAGYDAARCLWDKNGRNFAIVSGPMEHVLCQKRAKGFIDGLTSKGASFHPEMLFKGDYSFRAGYDAFLVFEEQSTVLDAVFCMSDQMAAGYARHALDAGYDVGNDIRIIGFDNMDFTEMYKPSLSTVAQPCYEIGFHCIDLLLKQLQEPSMEKQHIVLEHRFILRESTGDTFQL